MESSYTYLNLVSRKNTLAILFGVQIHSTLNVTLVEMTIEPCIHPHTYPYAQVMHYLVVYVRWLKKYMAEFSLGYIA